MITIIIEIIVIVIIFEIIVIINVLFGHVHYLKIKSVNASRPIISPIFLFLQISIKTM